MILQGCMVFYVTIKECRRKNSCQANHVHGGKTDATVVGSQTKDKTNVTLSDCQAYQTGKFVDQVGAPKPSLVSVYNENADVFVESGPI